MMMRLCAEDPDPRNTHEPPPRRHDLTGQQPAHNRDNNTDFTEGTTATTGCHRTATATTDRITTTGTATTASSATSHQHSNRIVEVLTLKLKESENPKRARGMAPKPNVVLEQSMVPEPSVLLEPEYVTIPGVDDLVIEILTDQMIDFDESSTDVLRFWP